MINKTNWLSKIGKVQIATTKKPIRTLSDLINQRYPKAKFVYKKAF
jgi:hypothetical protein